MRSEREIGDPELLPRECGELFRKMVVTSILDKILNPESLSGSDPDTGVTAVFILEDFVFMAEQTEWIVVTDQRPRQDLRLALLEHHRIPAEIAERQRIAHALAPWCWVTVWAKADKDIVHENLLEEALRFEAGQFPKGVPNWLYSLDCPATIVYYSEDRLGGLYVTYSLERWS